MTDEEYAEHQEKLILLGQAVHAMQLDLPGFLARISLAETVAPILDPTLYLRGREQLHQIKRLAQALRPFQAEIERQLEES